MKHYRNKVNIAFIKNIYVKYDSLVFYYTIRIKYDWFVFYEILRDKVQKIGFQMCR